MRTYEATEAHLRKLGKEIEKLKQAKTGRWKPKSGDDYWYIYTNGDVWRDNDYNNKRYSIGNVFRTKEEAEFKVERLKVIAELKEYASEFVYGRNNYYINWSFSNDSLKICWLKFEKSCELYFESEEIARQAIEAVGEDRVKKHYLGVGG